ncbi:hypothetical protein S7711_10523 [Stachybotrys chartarum IBT 7711]|uniref:Uncharacterized protein n=1 Tax=Stachybotrys chartarum (strain CBS 109288 / IBT 7711) TaxID=1280523 RepID=A0A084AMP4_STACB|nr:hypothetical protein S7711_10523 [Stachybotrys chartarum IBT 7711]KFA48867.1 hypothetical protein S40293_10528 [Stachybotrys chartarum IBT 40293]
MCLILLLVLHFRLSYDSRTFTDVPTPTTYDQTIPTDTIPNVVHFVYLVPDLDGDFVFQFSHFLLIYGAWYYWQPSIIYIHTNAGTNGMGVMRARKGQAGKWAHHIFTLFENLEIRTMKVPSHADNGEEIKVMEHKSDFVRVRAVDELGGIYIDYDVHALRDIRVIRDSGFKAIAGRQKGGQINSGTFISARKSKMTKPWLQ